MNVGLHSRTDFTVLSVYFGALHWCFGESGCLGDRSIKPKGSLMIGRNIPLILSGVPCLLLRNVQNGNNEVMFCFLFCFSSLHSCGYFLHKLRSCIVMVDLWWKIQPKLGAPIRLLLLVSSPPYICWQFRLECMQPCHYTYSGHGEYGENIQVCFCAFLKKENIILSL